MLDIASWTQVVSASNESLIGPQVSSHPYIEGYFPWIVIENILSQCMLIGERNAAIYQKEGERIFFNTIINELRIEWPNDRWV
jgi:hypothetical protein